MSNHTDRILLFALLMAAPTILTGPLRYFAARPTRRWAFYLVLTAFTATLTLGRG